jgi:tetratricopeptide (TPR) repeat protein
LIANFDISATKGTTVSVLSTLTFKKYFYRVLKNILIFSILFFSFSFGWAKDSSDLVVHFETNGRDLNSVDQSRLKDAFKDFDRKSEAKILVVGYTDSTGTTNGNYALSRSRAKTVKNYLISLMKLDSAKIVAVGRGSESPVVKNDTVKNRALNRRAEIFILNTPGSMLVLVKPTKPTHDPKDYLALLEEAQRLVKIGDYKEALVILKEAQTKGADQDFLWHFLCGVIGYHQKIEPNKLIAFFDKALQLNPNNLDVIDFWGRARARKVVEKGMIKADMGRSLDAPIKVETFSQMYEFMQLFGVDALNFKRLPNKPIDVWRCQTSKSDIIEYYFDVSSAYHWVYPGNNQQMTTEDMK